MNSVLFLPGVACVVGAVVGGGFKAFGLELPSLASVRRQVLLGLIGIALMAGGSWDVLNAAVGTHSSNDNSTTAGATKPTAPEATKHQEPVVEKVAPPAAAQANAITTASTALIPDVDGSSHESRATLLQRVQGRWSFGDCAQAAVFTIYEGTLAQKWPKLPEAFERITSANDGTVVTKVITPKKQRGQKFEYTPLGSRMTVDDDARSTTDTLKRCP